MQSEADLSGFKPPGSQTALGDQTMEGSASGMQREASGLNVPGVASSGSANARRSIVHSASNNKAADPSPAPNAASKEGKKKGKG